MIRFISCALMLLGSQAAALSCIAPDPVMSFHQADEDPDPIFILHGQVIFDESLLPQGVVNETRDPDPIPGVFQGAALTRTGFNAPFESDVTVQSICAGPWCGGMASGAPYLMFVRDTAAGLVVEVNPCGGTVFQDPAVQVLDQMTHCIRGERCEKPTQ